MVTHMHGKGRRALIERKRKLGGYYEQSLWLFPDWVLARNKEVWLQLLSSAVVSEHDSSPWSWFPNFIWFKKKFHSSRYSFSSVRNWATPTYFTVHCLARLPPPKTHSSTFPVYLIVNCPFMYTHFHTARVAFLLPNKILIFIFYLSLNWRKRQFSYVAIWISESEIIHGIQNHSCCPPNEEKICVSECKPKQSTL